VPLTARLVGARESYTLDLGGKTAEEFRKLLLPPAAGQDPNKTIYPASPKVGLKLELTNTSKEEIKIRIAGPNYLTLDLKGPGTAYAPFVLRQRTLLLPRPRIITLAPGKTITLADIPTLALPRLDKGSQAYWTAPGKYTLVIDSWLGVSPAPPKSRDLGNGFGHVVVHSAPVTLKVVAPK
jgi:hypothetical protein